MRSSLNNGHFVLLVLCYHRYLPDDHDHNDNDDDDDDDDDATKTLFQ